jgi:hypothetical protein
MFMLQRISIAWARFAPSNLDALSHRAVAVGVDVAGQSNGREEPVAPTVAAVSADTGPKMKAAPSGCSELLDRSRFG